MQQQNPATGDFTVSDGWLTACHHCRSPNFSQRPAGQAISLLVIHNISLPPGQFGGQHIENFFCNELTIDADPSFIDIARLQVSAHLLINRLGDITQFVSFKDRAWHAGPSSFRGRHRCNDYSIGIELEGTDIIPYTDVQYSTLIKITKWLMVTYPFITEQRIVGHNDIAPGRKTDPGPVFDWQHYRQNIKTS